MKKSTCFFISLLFFNYNSKAIDTVYFSPKISENCIVIDYKNTCLTFKESPTSNIYQFKNNSKEKTLFFEFNEVFEILVYNAYFNDNGSSYKYSKNAYKVNEIEKPLCIVSKYYIDKQNDIYAIVSGQNAKPAVGGNPQKDFTMEGFYCVIKIGENIIEKIYPIDDAFISPDYFLLNTGEFFKNESGFVFSLIKREISSQNNYILGLWNENNGRLKYVKTLEAQIPDFHKKNNLNYGLLNYIQKENYIMFYIGNSIIDLSNNKEHILSSKTDIEKLNNQNLSYNQSFSINNSNCDFSIISNKLNIIKRKNNKFYLAVYVVDNNFKLESEKEIPFFILPDLVRFPMFDPNGNIIFQIKNKNYFIRVMKSEV